jgi:Ran GTPase-activating protein (RanGAP) involved in mRNA processing and transport
MNPNPLSLAISSVANPNLSFHITVKTFQQRMHTHIQNIRDFCDGLEYQVQFNDMRMLQELEERGNGFLEYVKECLGREGRLREHKEREEEHGEREERREESEESEEEEEEEEGREQGQNAATADIVINDSIVDVSQ